MLCTALRIAKEMFSGMLPKRFEPNRIKQCDACDDEVTGGNQFEAKPFQKERPCGHLRHSSAHVISSIVSQKVAGCACAELGYDSSCEALANGGTTPLRNKNNILQLQ